MFPPLNLAAGDDRHPRLSLLARHGGGRCHGRPHQPPRSSTPKRPDPNFLFPRTGGSCGFRLNCQDGYIARTFATAGRPALHFSAGGTSLSIYIDYLGILKYQESRFVDRLRTAVSHPCPDNSKPGSIVIAARPHGPIGANAVPSTFHPPASRMFFSETGLSFRLTTSCTSQLTQPGRSHTLNGPIG